MGKDNQRVGLEAATP